MKLHLPPQPPLASSTKKSNFYNFHPGHILVSLETIHGILQIPDHLTFGSSGINKRIIPKFNNPTHIRWNLPFEKGWKRGTFFHVLGGTNHNPQFWVEGDMNLNGCHGTLISYHGVTYL